MEWMEMVVMQLLPMKMDPARTVSSDFLSLPTDGAN